MDKTLLQRWIEEHDVPTPHLVAVHSSATVLATWKPVTTAALSLFDPDLRLVWDRRRHLYVVMRRVSRFISYGDVGAFEDVLVHVTDWLAGLEGRDDPAPLIKQLWESDTFRHPNLSDDRVAVMQHHQERVRASVHDNYLYAHRWNLGILERAWEPLVNFPSLVN